jgi:hypothetical protein
VSPAVAEVFDVGQKVVEMLVAKMLDNPRERVFGADLLVAHAG